MQLLSSLLALVVICATAAPAIADDYAEYDKESYPKELVKRPLLLAPSMFEVRFGGASDFASDPSADRFKTKIDFIYGVGTRMQAGLETQLGLVPTDDFAVDNIAVWAEYNIVPTLSGRVEGFVLIPHDFVADELGDAVFGVRAGAPIRVSLGDKAALVSHPRIAFADGDSITEVPVGVQFQLVSSLAVVADLGLTTRNFEFTDDDTEDTWDLPLSAGVVLHFSRKIDLTVEFLFTDVANDSDSRWLLAFFSFRG
jgi:hypothetical protein